MAITPSLLPGMSSKTFIDEGVAKAMAAGVYIGRKPSVNVEAVKALRVSGKGPPEIAKELRIGRTSVYRAL
jgi:DNA invertase Pin-like site-specific DNA recombinase